MTSTIKTPKIKAARAEKFNQVFGDFQAQLKIIELVKSIDGAIRNHIVIN